MAPADDSTPEPQAPATRMRLIAHHQTDEAHRADQHAARIEQLATMRICAGLDCDNDATTAAMVAGALLLRQQAIALRKAAADTNGIADTLQALEPQNFADLIERIKASLLADVSKGGEFGRALGVH